MAFTAVTFNGVGYSIPQAVGDLGWSGTFKVDGLLVSLARNTLSLNGGTRTLTADLNLGASFGLVSIYFKSTSANIAAAGIQRLAVTDTINWRNNANSSDNILGVNASDQLTYNTNVIFTTNNILSIASGGTNSSTTLNNNRFIVSSGSKIVEASAVTANSAVASDSNGLPTASSTTATELGFVHGVTSAIQTQINGISPAVTGLNRLINANFDVWQNGTSTTNTATGAGSPVATYKYGPDQWYNNNILGGGTVEGIITISQTTGVSNGALFGCKVQITTAPTGTGIQNGSELYQVLCNEDSLPFYGQNASFTIQVKSFGNVNQVGIQLFYATSEVKLTTSIGSEVLTTVNTSTFTACTITGQAVGTSQTTAGVIGVRIRPTQVSSGNLYDLNNGFVVEQGVLVVGSTLPAAFVREANTFSEILRRCQFFFEKSYDPATAIATNTLNGMFCIPTLGTGSNQRGTCPFKVSKRTTPAMSLWDKAGNASRVTGFVGAGTETDNLNSGSSLLLNIGLSSFAYNDVSLISATSYTSMCIHWTADARI